MRTNPTQIATILICYLLFSPVLVQADTIGRLMPVANQAVITVFRGRVSGDDSNGKFLFDSMNVPTQGTFLGPGKSIADSSKVLSWVCGDRGADGHQCTFMIQSGAATKIGFSPMSVRYEVNGTEAKSLFSQITANTTAGEFKFTNTEGTLSLTATVERFLLDYRE